MSEFQVHRFKVDKLIRDKMPGILRASGVTVSERVMKKEEYVARLNDKLFEEAQEVIKAANPQELREELADVLEVVMAIARVNEISFDEIVQVNEQKRAKKGGFDKAAYCAFVEMGADNPRIDYYRTRPDQYREIPCDDQPKLDK